MTRRVIVEQWGMDVAKEEADWFGAGGTRRDKNGGLELLEVNRTSDMLWWLAGWLAASAYVCWPGSYYVANITDT